MAYDQIEIFSEAGTVGADGVFLPWAELPGLMEADLGTVGALLEGRLTYALLNSLFEAIAQFTPLGFPAPEKSDPSGTGTNRYTEQVTLKIQRVLDLRTQSLSLPPLPITGTYQGQGGFTLEDCWPTAALVETGDTTSGAGIVLPHTWIDSYGGTAPSAIDTDCRGWFAALIVALNHSAAVRTVSAASAITRKTPPETIRPTGTAIASEWTDATNPTTGLTTADLPYVRLVQESVAIEYELETDPDTQTFEVRVATTI